MFNELCWMYPSSDLRTQHFGFLIPFKIEKSIWPLLHHYRWKRKYSSLHISNNIGSSPTMEMFGLLFFSPILCYLFSCSGSQLYLVRTCFSYVHVGFLSKFQLCPLSTRNHFLKCNRLHAGCGKWQCHLRPEENNGINSNTLAIN
jgi:hypothetical protein